VENRHRNHILDETIAPAEIGQDLAAKAESVARALAERLDYVGVLAVEMFEIDDGVLVNEIAPRVHNSGHWTIDACAMSQFEAHIRAVTGLALVDVGMHSRAVMKNLLGKDIEERDALVGEPNLRFHDYGKAEAREGRKMGHVTRLYPL
ncbi:MAG: ATP-grasp domain-containing protein, partial [Alphaproteobacteria bacterium]